MHKANDNAANNNLSMNSLQSGDGGKRQPKRDSRHTISDDEPTTDWTPEIPFWNVSDFRFLCQSTASIESRFAFQLNDSDESQAEATNCTSEYVNQETAVPISATEDEVDDFIDQNIQINSNKQMRVEYLYPWTLKFKDSKQESKYCQLREDMFRSNMISVFIVWIFIVLCQAIIIPRCTTLVICLAVSTILLTAGCVLVMAEEFSALPIILQKSSSTLVHHRNRRTLFICSVIILMSAASSIGLFLCPMERDGGDIAESNSSDLLPPFSAFAMQNTSTETPPNRTFTAEIRFDVQISATIHRNFSDGTNSSALSSAEKLQRFSPQELNEIKSELLDKLANKTSSGGLGDDAAAENFRAYPNRSRHVALPGQSDLLQQANGHAVRGEWCSHPDYMVFTWVLCLIALATGLKLYYLVKTFMATIMVCCYAVLILVIFPEVFERAAAENLQYGIPLSARMNILLIVFLTMVTYHARLVEVTSRLDFIWKEQAEKELSNMKSNRILNDLLIKVRKPCIRSPPTQLFIACPCRISCQTMSRATI